jgi:hypothetical protein
MGMISESSMVTVSRGSGCGMGVGGGGVGIGGSCRPESQAAAMRRQASKRKGAGFSLRFRYERF